VVAQRSTLVAVNGPVVEFPRLSVAVTLAVTFPPTGNGPIVADQLEPSADIGVLPAPEGPVHFSTTDARPLGSVTGALTRTVRPRAVHPGRPKVRGPIVGGRSFVIRTATRALPPDQMIVTMPDAAPSDISDRWAVTWTVDEPSPGTDPLAWETTSHDLDVATR
jgi:hypothetical protein